MRYFDDHEWENRRDEERSQADHAIGMLSIQLWATIAAVVGGLCLLILMMRFPN